MKVIETTYLNVNVADTRRINNGHFYVEIPNLLQGESVTHRLYIIKAIIPYNWQTVTDGQDTFTISDPNPTTYTLTTGIPNVLDLMGNINYLQSKISFTFNRIANKWEIYNLTANNITLTSTCPLLGLGGNPLVIPALTMVQAPDLIDMRPQPVIQLRCNLPTAMWEIINNQGTSEIRNTSVLAVIGMGGTPLYSHLIWRSGVDALYMAELGNAPNTEVEFEMLDTEDNPIVPQTPPIFVLAVETLRDDEERILKTQEEILKLAQYDMLLKNQQLLVEPTNKKV